MTPTGSADEPRGTVVLRAAGPGDTAVVRSIVQQAYRPYVEELGFEPGPLRDDHAGQVAGGQVTLAEVAGSVVGLVVLSRGDAEPVIENVAVRPPWHGRGVCATLLDHAEAAALSRGHRTIALYTHELMTLNIEIYTRRGYRPFAADPLPSGHRLIHLRKELGPRNPA